MISIRWYLGFLKGQLGAAGYRVSYGTDFDNSELAGPLGRQKPAPDPQDPKQHVMETRRPFTQVDWAVLEGREFA